MTIVPDVFRRVCQAEQLPVPVPELKFHPSRRWRFDWAWPDQRVALEVQGGLFIRGRHSRGPALVKEHEKLNAAAALGWRVIYTTPDRLLTDGVDAVKAALTNGE